MQLFINFAVVLGIMKTIMWLCEILRFVA